MVLGFGAFYAEEPHRVTVWELYEGPRDAMLLLLREMTKSKLAPCKTQRKLIYVVKQSGSQFHACTLVNCY